MSLLNLRANFNTVSNPDKKLKIVEQFETSNPGKFFYNVNLGERYKKSTVQFDLVDKELRSTLANEMVLADIAIVNQSNKLIGGLFFGNVDKINAADQALVQGIQASGQNWAGPVLSV
jgi:hypothetical protein